MGSTCVRDVQLDWTPGSLSFMQRRFLFSSPPLQTAVHDL